MGGPNGPGGGPMGGPMGGPNGSRINSEWPGMLFITLGGPWGVQGPLGFLVELQGGTNGGKIR